ncbi:hypothetical protein A3Q56_05064 [Intoshia linei]|uniref:Cullin family profile domain-containing protein n=1 Tax=Intoshia linei TaxID=1819745 RepID=A0A177B0G3_9BILA|nr:hypothetical protein A3Q56_05064 [Intoshia linei]
MVDDIEFSLNYTETFYSNYENLERNTQFYVLQSLSWPCSNVPEYLLLPDELNSAFKLFQDEYVQEYSTRKLLIHPKLSTATLDFFKYDENDNCKLYSLCVNTYHLMVLYLFNQKSTLSFKEISTLTRIEDEQAKFTIKQLIDIGLLKEDNINKYNENIYSINEDFESNSSNILNLEDVNHVLTRNNQFTYTLNENRQLLINSIISNIMKKHKSLTIKKIVDEVKLKVDSYFDCTHNMVTDGLYYLVYRAHILEIDEKE